MNTQDLINEARRDEYFRAGYGEKADWLQYGTVTTANGRKIDVELRLVGNKYDPNIKIMRTTFYRGCLRISRAEAEELLAS